MAEHLQEQNISAMVRQKFISNLPCFSTLSPQQNAELAALFVEEHVESGEVIVTEDDLVDNVYIIVSGTAEVSRKFVRKRKLSKKLKIINTPVGLLSAGE